MTKTILIAGGSGLIGSFLANGLRSTGHEVRILTRDKEKSEKEGYFLWDVSERHVEQAALLGVDIVVNLAGNSIADGRWTKQRKANHYKSRIGSTGVLLEAIERQGIKLSCYVGASAVGIYGDRGSEILNEGSKTGQAHYLVDLCGAWESAHAAFSKVSSRVSIVRIGIVLSNQGGALPEMRKSLILGTGAYFGNGAQYMPWVHIEDLAHILKYVIERPLEGVVNAVSPNPVTNYDFMKSLVSLERGPGWLLPVPGFSLKLILGEMSAILLQSQRVSPAVLQDTTFEFKYHGLHQALVDLRTKKE